MSKLKKVNKWQWLAWVFVIAGGIVKYGETHSFMLSILNSLGIWTLITLGAIMEYQKVEDEDL